ncbi:MAG: cupin domain-containing protein [Gemmobacter sp.]
MQDATQDFDVGGRLRQLRQGAGLSQRALAEASGVPHGQISMIETNRSSPSVASLRRILGGLGVTLSEFFEPDRGEEDAVFFRAGDLRDLTSRLRGQGRDGAGRITLRQVGEARAMNLQILFERYEPGADTGPEMLEHPSTEGGVVISGRVEVTVGERVATLGPGDAYLFRSTEPHRFRNPGPDEAVIVSACTPPYL